MAANTSYLWAFHKYLGSEINFVDLVFCLRFAHDDLLIKHSNNCTCSCYQVCVLRVLVLVEAWRADRHKVDRSHKYPAA